MDEARIAELLEPFLSDGRPGKYGRDGAPELSPRPIAAYIDVHRFTIALERPHQSHRDTGAGRNCDAPFWRIHLRRQAIVSPARGWGRHDSACDRHWFRSRLPRAANQNMGAARSPDSDRVEPEKVHIPA